MARRTFDVIDVVEVLAHWHAGRPKLVIAESLGLDVKTVRKYVAPAEAAGIVPGGPPLDRASWAELVRGWFPELVDPRARSLTHSVIAPHRALIEAMLKTNTVTTVHQRLRDEHGLGVSLTSLRRYVWAEFPDVTLREQVRVPRPPGERGEEALCGKPHRASYAASANMRRRARQGSVRRLQDRCDRLTGSA